MTKLFLTVILFLLTLALLALDPSDFVSYFDTPVDLTYGITAPAYTPLNAAPAKASYTPTSYYLSFSNEPMDNRPAYNAWYMEDFAEDPFDGNLEIFVLGEPLPPARTTILIMLAVVGIIYWNRFKFRYSAA